MGRHRSSLASPAADADARARAPLSCRPLNGAARPRTSAAELRAGGAPRPRMLAAQVEPGRGNGGWLGRRQVLGTAACSSHGGRRGGRCSTFLAAVDVPHPLRDPTLPRPERGEAGHARPKLDEAAAGSHESLGDEAKYGGGSSDGGRRDRGSAPHDDSFVGEAGARLGRRGGLGAEGSGREALVREVGDGVGWKGSSVSAPMASGGGGHEGKGRARLGEGTGAPESFDTHLSFRSTLDRQRGVPHQQIWYICMPSAL
jgi:hypothetical protein